MGKQLDITPSEVWTGAFTWEGYFMRKYIATVKHDYDPDVPQTWPLIEDVTHTESKSNYKKSKTPPARMAYSQSVMRDLLEHQPMQRTSYGLKAPGNNKLVPARYLEYPFNFDIAGHLRTHPHIPEHELKNWLEHVKVPVKDASDARIKKAVPQQATTETLPDSAFAVLVQKITGPEILQSAVVTDLQQQLDQAKENALEYKCKYEDEVKSKEQAEAHMRAKFQIKADEFSKKAKEVCKGHVAQDQMRLEKIQVRHTTALALEIEKTTKAAKEIEDLKIKLEERTRELANARSEVDTTSQKIHAIWTEMQKPKGAELEKRKADEDAGGEWGKKIKKDEVDG